ncbi:hypothetical protein NC652_021067 [Populus alba x Populus x berolinensis]|nr:hypothetical protein NC652_021067 [Populus alba x Populus x berolinensis]
MQEAANGCGTIFLLKLNQLHPKCAYHVCTGNLEYDWPLQPWKPDWSNAVYGTDGGCECWVPYNSSESTGTRAPGLETDFVSGSSQYNFIKQDLESVNRSKTPFVVVQRHRPIYERFSPVCNFTCESTWKGFLVHGTRMDICMIWWRYWHLEKFSVVETALVRKLETGLS